MAAPDEAAARVQNIPIKDISANPHNPRRLFDEEPLEILKESVAKLGILVPITVYEEGKRKTAREKFVILDGERRWRVAGSLKMETIPAIVVDEPSEERNILTMFHIHNLREGWQLMPTALKLHVLMEKLGTRSERKLSELTKLSLPQIRRCKILLGYPKTYQNLMLSPPNERMKADFFIELERVRGPARQKRFPPWVERGDVRSIRIFLDKYQRDVIPAVTDFRKLAETYHASERVGKTATFMKRLDKFMSEPEAGIDEIEVPGATFAVEAKEIRRSASRLLGQLQDLDLEDISAEEDVIELLRELRDLLDNKLNAALLLRVHE